METLVASPRKIANQRNREAKRVWEESHQKPVRKITICIEWKKSRMWGRNPHAMADVFFHDGTHERMETTCGGCGYDKESTVIADIFNRFLKYKLYLISWRKYNAKDKQGRELRPYGIRFSKADTGRSGLPYGEHRSFEGGIGTSCYTDYSTSYGRRGIAQYIGGSFRRIACGKTFDAYEYTDKGEK